ncbi:MAG: ATP-binding protein [Maricaulis sp.]|jgi:DNA-binding beta-propeller fold protein YncE|nr:ATP-binding protein [Maricaulis sp.]
MIGMALALTLQSAAGVSLEPVWETDGFSQPESVAWSDETGFLYVSNIAGEPAGADDDGFISRVHADGRIETLRWAETGLSAPKGLAIAGDRLFVTDITAIAVFDLQTGALISRHPVEGAGFLNDALALDDGSVLVSDSVTGRIHRLAEGAVTLWLEGELLSAINGLYQHDGTLFAVTMRDRFLEIDMDSRAVTVRATGIASGDGLAPLPGGRWLANEWPGRLFVIGADGTVETLEDTRETGSLMNDFILVEGRLYMAHLRAGTVSARDVREMN